MKFFNKNILKEYGFMMTQKRSNPMWTDIYNMELEFLCVILYNLYRWENLPETMDSRFLEKTLMQDGVAGLFDHPQYGPINTRATWGEMGFYDIPIRSTFYNIWFQDSVYVGRDSSNAVLVLNNCNGGSYVRIALIYAYRLACASVTHDINLEAQKTPILIDGDYSQLEQLVNSYASYIGGSPVIARRTNVKAKSPIELEQKPLTAIKTDAPYVADKVHESYNDILHEFYSKIGINYANNNKRERMLVDEVNANNQQLGISYSAGLQTREEAADQYNKIHGTQIRPVFNTDIWRMIIEHDNIGADSTGRIYGGNGQLPDSQSSISGDTE